MKRKRKRVTEKEKALIIQLSAEMRGSQIARQMKRSQGTISAILSTHRKAAGVETNNIPKKAEVALANLALERANGSVLTVGIGNLVDLLANKAPEVEMILIDVKARRCKVTVRRELEFTV